MTTQPRIVAPVSRQLSVANVERSTAFYREVLGFQVVAPLELVSGPARLQLTTDVQALDSTLRVQPRGAAILFFETDDVAAMRETVRARGGVPSELENVNWIKMRMFQMADRTDTLCGSDSHSNSPTLPRIRPGSCGSCFPSCR